MSRTHDRHHGGYIEDQREFFDRLVTDDWEQYSNPAWNRAREKEVNEIFSIVGDQVKTVLDVGCGCGYHDRVIASRPGVESVLGVDYSPQSVLQAEKHYAHPKVKRIALDVFDKEATAPYRKQFDLVVSFAVIEHLTNAKAFLNIKKSFVKDGGYVAIMTPNWKRLENRVRSAFGMKYGFCDPLHYKEYSLPDMRQMGEECGLQFAGAFGHTYHFMLKRFTLLNCSWGFSYRRFPTLVNLANFIGVVFKA